MEWIAAGVLIAFSALSGFSIGLFYAPAAFALLVAATLGNLSASPVSRDSGS